MNLEHKNQCFLKRQDLGIVPSIIYYLSLFNIKYLNYTNIRAKIWILSGNLKNQKERAKYTNIGELKR